MTAWTYNRAAPILQRIPSRIVSTRPFRQGPIMNHRTCTAFVPAATAARTAVFFVLVAATALVASVLLATPATVAEATAAPSGSFVGTAFPVAQAGFARS
jgi:hypothetical protein